MCITNGDLSSFVPHDSIFWYQLHKGFGFHINPTDLQDISVVMLWD